MAWIKKIAFGEAEGRLKSIYDRIDNYIDNIMMAHGLRPHTLEGHMSLYKNVLHNKDSTLHKWFREAIGVYVSLLNGCKYCVEHHSTGMARLIDEKSTAAIMQALEEDAPDQYFGGKELAIMDYVRKLTLAPEKVIQKDVSLLQVTGLSDGEILEINQATSYFAYGNRVVTGLGIDTKGEIIGLSPGSEAEDNW